jgi:AcrR family transcriptional regulator
MASTTRLGAPDAKNRGVLLDAAERLMLEHGYAAVTSRGVARVAGLKHQLVHYYFRTMDDLFVAMFRRRAEEGLRHQAEALASPRPLRALLAFNSAAASAAVTLQFVALANHREALRAEVLKYSRRFRQAELDAMPELMRRYGVDVAEVPPAAVVLSMASISRFILLERALGMDEGHAETLAFVERQLLRLEGPQTMEPADAAR